ncbi:hypothetical protein DFH09DRAFT_1076206 [Mycena vulgaris]|nr:hypothetical protein DFH09DRAFT_1076206 [Mycena vulgaris]
MIEQYGSSLLGVELWVPELQLEARICSLQHPEWSAVDETSGTHRLYHVNRECHIVRTSQEKRQPTNRDIGGLSRCGAANNVWSSQPQRSVKAAIRTTFWGTGEIGLWVREQNLDERSYDHMFSIGELARPFREKINELDPQR